LFLWAFLGLIFRVGSLSFFPSFLNFGWRLCTVRLPYIFPSFCWIRFSPCTLGDAIIRPQGSCTPLLTGVLNRRDYIDLPARSRNSISNFQPNQTPFIMLHHRRRGCIHHHTPLSHYVQHLVCLPRRHATQHVVLRYVGCR
jgi:hypothetical protein